MAKIYSKSALYFLNACYTREKAITPAQKEKLDASAKCNTEFNKWQGYDNEVWARKCTAPPNGGGVKWLVGYIIAGICMLICYFICKELKRRYRKMRYEERMRNEAKLE